MKEAIGTKVIDEEFAMRMQEYLKNRRDYSLQELAKHRGEWIAWSPDGRRVVATSRDPDALDDLIRAAGEDPENCPIEGIPDSDCVIGGSLAHALILTAPTSNRWDSPA